MRGVLCFCVDCGIYRVRETICEVQVGEKKVLLWPPKKAGPTDPFQKKMIKINAKRTYKIK